MSFNTGINRVFLLGTVNESPAWQIIEGQRMLCFTLITTEEVKKGTGSYEHTELHTIKISPELIRNRIHIEKDEMVYIQGKIQTRTVFENGVKLYKAEILATSVEHLKTANKYLHVL
jgi:single-stranded DNA-binding protein